MKIREIQTEVKNQLQAAELLLLEKRGKDKIRYGLRLAEIVDGLLQDEFNNDYSKNNAYNVDTQPFNMKDKTRTYLSFFQKYGKQREYTIDRMNLFYSELSKVYAYTLSKKGVSIEKEVKSLPGGKEDYCECSPVKRYSELQIRVQTVKNGKFKLWDMQKILTHPLAKNIIYSQYAFIPFDHGKFERHPEFFNTYFPFESKLLKLVELQMAKNALRPILFHTKYVLCGGDDLMYRGCLSWQANIVQRPYIKTNKMCVFTSKRGVGKSSYINWLKKYMFGTEKTHTANTVRQCVNQFNGERCSKLLIVINDLKDMSDMITAYSAFIRLTTDITGENIKNNEKYVPSKNQPDYGNIVGFATNEFIVDENEHRFIVFRCSEEYMKQTNYFKIIFESYTSPLAELHYAFLMYYDAIDMHDIKNTPISKLKKELRKNSMSPTEYFISALTNGEYKAAHRVAKMKHEDEYMIVSLFLSKSMDDCWFMNQANYFELYKDFCSMHNIENKLKLSEFVFECRDFFKRQGLINPKHPNKIIKTDRVKYGVKIQWKGLGNVTKEVRGYYMPAIQNDYTLENENQTNANNPDDDNVDENSIDEDNIDEIHKHIDPNTIMTRQAFLDKMNYDDTLFDDRHVFKSYKVTEYN